MNALMKRLTGRLPLPALAALVLALAACAPTTATPQQPVSPPVTVDPGPTAPAHPAEAAAADTALTIWHRMELGKLQNGTYSTQVLLDVDLPRGIAWTTETFPGESFSLRVTDDALPGVYWLVTPAGVERIETAAQAG